MKDKIMRAVVILLAILLTTTARAELVKYNFDIDTKNVNFTNKNVVALAINNQIPGPTIEATVGDILEVTFNNKMNEETSIHWHGILLPNDQDGVLHLTTSPISPHSSFTYKYKITHSGTYWYHSHTGLQEQKGIYGSLVFHPKNGELLNNNQLKLVG
jgi:FtsP/CotA-like multicopper oxidase with cupredoxin domain